MNTLPNDLLTLVGGFLNVKQSSYLYLHTNNKIFECQPLSADEAVKKLDWRWIHHYLLSNYSDLFVAAGKFKYKKLIIISKDRHKSYILEGYAIGGHLEEFKIEWSSSSHAYVVLVKCCILAMNNNQFDIVGFCISKMDSYSSVTKSDIIRTVFNICDDMVSINMIDYIHDILGYNYVNHILRWAAEHKRFDVVNRILSYDHRYVQIATEVALRFENIDMLKNCISDMNEVHVRSAIIIATGRYNRIDMLKSLVDDNIVSKNYILEVCKEHCTDFIYRHICEHF